MGTGLHLFFVQLEPDIDIITPIVYALSRNKYNKILVVCSNVLYDARTDYRLTFLNKIENISIKCIYELKMGFPIKLRYTRLLLLFPKWILFKFKRAFWQKLYFKTSWINDKKKFGAFLKSNNISSVTTDVALPLHTKDVIYGFSKKLKIPFIMVETGAKITKFEPRETFEKPKADYLIKPHNLYNIKAPKGIMFLGNPRYYVKWQKINSKLIMNSYPKIGGSEGSRKLKVLIFSRPFRNFDRKNDIVNRICGLNFVTAIVKDKPRTFMPKILVDAGFDKYPSSRLIKWADVVISSKSSIILDILHYDKIFIYPKYIAPEDHAVFEDYSACWKIESPEELIDALRLIYKNPSCRPYKAEDVEKFYADVVCCGEKNKDVLEEYSKFYQSISKKHI